MKLQILVPRYTEPFLILKRLLDSIAIQQCIDFSEVQVIILDDGFDNKLSPAEFNALSDYPYEIKYFVNPHLGISATRDTLLDFAIADYVMWCDCDDLFFNALGLYLIFRRIDKGFDLLVSKFVEEARHPETGEPVFVYHEQDTTFVHGKVFRRAFLLKHNIRWNKNLMLHEDSYFIRLARVMCPDAVYDETPFYLWKWNDNSVCRGTDLQWLRTYGQCLDSSIALIRELSARGKELEAKQYAGGQVLDYYARLKERKDWLDEHPDVRIRIAERFAVYLTEIEPWLSQIPDSALEEAQPGIVEWLGNII